MILGSYRHFIQCEFNSIQTSTTLANFLLRNTQLATDLCLPLFTQLGNEFELFLAALILRHSAQLKQKTLRLRYTILKKNVLDLADEKNTHANANDNRTKNGTFVDYTPPVFSHSVDEHAAASVSRVLAAFDAPTVAGQIRDYLATNGAGGVPTALVLSSQVPPAVHDNGTKRTANSSSNSNGLQGPPTTTTTTVTSFGGHRLAKYLPPITLATAANADIIAQRQNQALCLFVADMYMFADYRTVIIGPSNGQPTVQIVRTVCGTLARVRHSCRPNAVVALSADGRRVVVKACRNIAACEEVCISYGVHHQLTARPARQRFLAERAVRCACCACTDHRADELWVSVCVRCRRW